MNNNLSAIANKVKMDGIVAGVSKFIVRFKGDILFETSIKGVYELIYRKDESTGPFSYTNFTSHNFLVLDNGYALPTCYLNGVFTYENNNVIRDLLYKLEDSIEELFFDMQFMQLEGILKTHVEAIEFMKKSVEDVKVNETHIRMINDREEIDGKKYHAEGMFDKNKVVDMFAEEIVETSTLSTFEIERVENRYVRSNDKYSTKNVYFLKNSNLIAIASPVFAPSDVYFLNSDEFATQVI